MKTAQNILHIRAQARLDLSNWFNGMIVDPFIDGCKKAGMSDDDTALALNQALFSALQGLHRFPSSRRPK